MPAMVHYYTTMYQSMGDDDSLDGKMMMVTNYHEDDVPPQPLSYQHGLDLDNLISDTETVSALLCHCHSAAR